MDITTLHQNTVLDQVLEEVLHMGGATRPVEVAGLQNNVAEMYTYQCFSPRSCSVLPRLLQRPFVYLFVRRSHMQFYPESISPPASGAGN